MKNKWILLAFLFAVSLTALLPGSSGDALLLQGDEVMHIATIRESLAHGEYILPRLNGEANYFKPPLLFWLGMASEKVFGTSLLSARLPAILLASFTVSVLFLFLLDITKKIRLSFFSSLIYLFTLGNFKFGRLLMMEQGMVFSLLLTTYLFYKYYKTRKKAFIILSSLTAGVSYLYKGPLFQVYTAILLLSWAGVFLSHFKFSPFAWKGKRYIRSLVSTLVLFHLIELVPILAWLSFLVYLKGSGILYYFFVVENYGKFFSENQNLFRIFSGWIFYAQPIGFALLYFAFYSLKLKIKSRNSLFARVIINTSFLLTLLHLLPNRKDGYYILPALPLMFIGTAHFMNYISLEKIQKVLKWNLLLNIIILSLFSVPIFVFAESLYYKIGIILSIVLSLLFYKIWKEYYPKNKSLIQFSFVVNISLFTLSTQFILLPALNHPLLPAEVKKQISGQVCVVSPEPWDAYLFKNSLPGVNVVHAVPQNLETCKINSQHILVFRAPENLQEISGFKKTFSYEIWKRQINKEALRSIKTKAFQKVFFFSR